MLRSLVGSEMCIRDSGITASRSYDRVILIEDTAKRKIINQTVNCLIILPVCMCNQPNMVLTPEVRGVTHAHGIVTKICLRSR